MLGLVCISTPGFRPDPVYVCVKGQFYRIQTIIVNSKMS